MKKGTLYWITGLSGAGKTTIGTKLYYTLKNQGVENILILDGDILKNIAGGGYSKEDREERAKKYSNLCKTITDQGISVICCTVAMFHQVRNWNRNNIENYVEIYIDVPMETLRKRDKKGLYSSSEKMESKSVAGIDVEAEVPINPDIIIENNDDCLISEAVKTIINYKPIKKDSFDRDTDYWNQYYQRNPVSQDNVESPFAAEVVKYMEPGKSLIEFGCGNGRDSLYFIKKGIEVVGIDISEQAIKMLNNRDDIGNSSFICEDFASNNAIFQKQQDYCYSRFTLHAITAYQEDFMLQNAWNSLKKNGLLFIEARSIHDELYGMGTCIGYNEYIYNDHYRRFICKEELEEKLKKIGFEILSSIENRGGSVYNGQDPVLIRIHSIKKEIMEFN